MGCFVEFFGPGVSQLSISDRLGRGYKVHVLSTVLSLMLKSWYLSSSPFRATISNMCPEYGATIGFFPVDEMSMKYLQQSARDPHRVSCAREYLKAVGMFRDYSDSNQDPVFSEVCLE